MQQQDTAVLVHGRHIQSKEFEQHLWTDMDGRLGTLPTAVIAMLHWGVDRIKLISIGTGSSQDPKTGLIEAELIQKIWNDRFDELDAIDRIGEHVQWQQHKQTIRELINGATTDTHSTNTRQEIPNAVALFVDNGVANVLQVTSLSHAPRCQINQSVLRADGVIPQDQAWFLVADQIPYSDSQARDVVIVEPPHKADDALGSIDYELLPSVLFQNFYYKLKTDDQRIQFLKDAHAAMQRIMQSGD